MNLPQFVSRPSLFLVFALAACPGLFTAQAAVATLKLAPSSVEAGQITVGTTATLSCTLTNGGPQTVTVLKATPSNSAYTITSPSFPLTLASGKNANVTIRFAPTTAHWVWATVAFTSNASDPTLYVQLNGGDVAAKNQGSAFKSRSVSATGASTTGSLSASRTSVNFGTVNAGSSSSITETLTNVGKSSVTISSASASGTGFSDTGISPPITLSPSQSITFALMFAPKAGGTDTGSLTVVSNAAIKALTIPLSGNSTAAGTLTVSPASVSLGNVAVGSSKMMSAALSVSGSSIVVSRATTTSSEFTVSGMSFPVTIAAGKSASFFVKFTPNSSGTTTGKLSFTGNAADSPAVELLTGTGTGASQQDVALSWKASSSSVTGYGVYRGTTSGGPYSRVNSSLDSSTSYTDATVQAGETYYYVVTGVNSEGAQSNYSNQVTAVVP